MKEAKRIFLIPGTGADHRMFSTPWMNLPGATASDWPAFDGEASLGEIAERIIARDRIGAGDVIVGVSLGGMVACEIARRVPAAGIVLVSSAMHPHEIRRVWRIIAPIIRFLPLRFFQRLVAGSRRPEFLMFADADARFIRAGVSAIFRWRGFSGVNGVRVLRIHGGRDLVIRPPEDRVTILDAGHMFTLTHAEECVSVIREWLR